ncbi:seipin-like isoform X2 [Dinothrombium tinctorium]|uniref:Seipin n=1 Tax=Dinothrombium tinctorium TaxID=1965070 RepID=A0A3S3P2F0_9ACAR|nr:seipin-like isoform X2 [Dinothrombium tinctorium]
MKENDESEASAVGLQPDSTQPSRSDKRMLAKGFAFVSYCCYCPRLLILFMWKTFRRMTFITICFVSIIWSSTFIYISLYYLFVPTVLHKKVINFQFDSNCLEKCLQPYADVFLSDYKTPTIFSRGQQYMFTVEIHLPESDVNWEQGLFMVKIELFDANQKLITSIARSAMLKYKSPLLRIIEIIVYWPLLITGFKHEEQFLSIPIAENYIDGVVPGVGNAIFARVKIEARQIQVYSSHLVIQANLRGLSVYRIVSSSEEEENECENDFESSGLIGEVEETQEPHSTTHIG